jgi:hypothetical protein
MTDEKLDRENFIKHLERATKEVESWPEWKQNLLGRIFKENDQHIKDRNYDDNFRKDIRKIVT